MHQTRSWKRKYIKSLVAIASPWGGHFMGMNAYIDTNDWLPTKLIPKIRHAERTFSSTAFRQPQSDSFGNKVLISTPRTNYTSLDILRYYDDLGLSLYANHWLHVDHVLKNFKHPEVDLYCFSGTGTKTLEGVVIKSGGLYSDDKVNVYGDGDGNINTISSRRCLNWINKNNFNRVYYREFKSVGHIDLVRDPYTLYHIIKTIT